MAHRSALALLVAALGSCSNATAGPSAAVGDAGSQPTFAEAADEAETALRDCFYDGQGNWNACFPAQCYSADYDWGADSNTDALYLRWQQSQDPSILPWMQALEATHTTWGPCVLPFCLSWSDIPMWDSIASLHLYQVTQDPAALADAESDFDTVAGSDAFAQGACPSIDYQEQPNGGPINLKTLESDSNFVKAALLLYEQTRDQAYLQRALAKYQAIRRYFLDPEVPLYTVFLFDDGVGCAQVPHRFFASVNGNMIWAGLHLSQDTNDASYLGQAVATATAVAQGLGDSTGLFVDMEGEDDVVEPLVEAMLELAAHQPFARAWILDNAAASRAARTSTGLFGRFFNGPPPAGTVTEWQANGGFALAFAAAQLAPTEAIPPDTFWSGSTTIAADLSDPPFSISFTGRGVALIGTLGAPDAGQDGLGAGHARIFIDGTETLDQTGICQNESPATVSPPSSSTSLPGSILFAWRWPASGAHTLTFQPGIENAKEGGSFLHVQSYTVAP